MRLAPLLALLLAAATLACVVPRPDRAADAPTLLMTVWGMPFEDRLFRDVYAAEFGAAQPGVDVRYERYPDVTQKYLAWHVLGRTADVMRVRITDYHLLVERGILRPIDDLLDDPQLGLSAAERADFVPAIWDALEIDGRRYAVPSDHAIFGLYWNRTLFDAHNAEAAPQDRIAYPDAGWTWDDLRRAARLLTRRDEDGRTTQFGLDVDLWAWPFMTLFAQAGGELWDERGTRPLLDSPAGSAALELLLELVPHASAMRAGDVRDAATGPDKLFATGRTAMLLDGSWRAPFLELIDPDLDFAVAPLPRGRERAIVGGSVLWAIGSGCEHPRLAWALIMSMTDGAGSLAYWDALRVAPPARLSVIASDAFRSTRGLRDDDGTILSPAMPRERWPDRGAWLLESIAPDPATGRSAVFVPTGPWQKDLEDEINALLSRAIAPGRRETLEALLEEAVERVEAIVRRAGGG